jgi:putative hydrolase of the HAD superfamily
MSQLTPGHPSTNRSRADVTAAVLFDLYGTLVEPDWAELLKGRTALAERVGLPAAAVLSAWDRTHLARMTGTYGSLADDLAAVFSQASDAASDAGRSRISPRLLSQLADEERENWRRGVRLHPDAMPAMSLLRSAGLRVAIVTNASAEAASLVDELPLRSLVDVFCSCELGVLKPHLLGVALRSLGLEASDAILVDDEPAELDGAARLGIGTILVQRSGGDAPGATAAGPRPTVSDLRQVAELVVPAAPERRR